MDLNAEQQSAVSHSNGPLLVAAGPGSGKTHVIVERVGRLVADGVPQESILCMTFTEKAADVMRRRLHERGASGVWVGTMHALCLEILKENSPTTGITEKTVIFGELARLAWCVRNIDELGIDSDVVNLDRDPRKPCAAMLRAIRLAKRELVSADDLERHAKTATSDPEEGKRLAQLAELAKVYRAYDTYKKEKDLIDYEDMVAMAVARLSQDDSMLETYKGRYGHVLVDEFQDNNYAQFLLAKLLAGTGNITVVGDGDQSIMGFQGAFDGIFDEFDIAYPDHKSVVLTRNYRCSGNISEISSQVLRADAGREAKPLDAERDDGEPVVVAAASSEAAEREFVAKTISDLDVPRSKVAVLCRTNKACHKFADTLRAHGVPAALVGAGYIMRNAAVAEVVALLRIADSPHTAGTDISYVLKARGIREYNIRAINVEARKKHGRDSSPVDGVFSVLEGYSSSDQDVEIREIVRRLRKMADGARSADLLDTLHKIMTEYSDAYKSNANADGYETARNLTLLNNVYRIAEDYQIHYRGERLSNFIEYLDMADDPDAADLAADDIEAGNAVSVLTIHKSKGKEFDVVFVTGLYDDDVPGKPKKEEFEIPRDLLKGKGRIRDPVEAHVHERRNLLYVAMTRAMDKLYLTYPKRAKDSAKDRNPSRFLVEIGYDDNPRIRTVEHVSAAQDAPPPRDVLEAEKSRIQEEACRAVRESRPEAVVRSMVELSGVLHAQEGDSGSFDPRSILDVDVSGIGVPPRPKIPLVNRDTLTLSATDIETYQECPLKFKYRKALRIPEKPAIYLKKGSAIHGALEWVAKERLAGREPDTDAAVRLASEELAAARGMYDVRDYEKAESSLEGIMEYYAEWEANNANELVGVEVKFETAIDGIVYRGKIDRVERNSDGRYEIVDFKTGSTTVTREKIKVLPQANIYAAAAKDMYGSLPAKVSLVYLTKRTSRKYEVTDGLLETGLGITKDCAKSITDEKFDATPGNHCRRCSYSGFCPEADL